MIRGIKFIVPSGTYPLLNMVMKSIDIKKYFWILVEEDVHKGFDKGFESYFDKDQYQGSEFEQIIKEECYVVLLNLQAYNNQSEFMRQNSYDDFLNSKCELIVFINDGIYVDIYAKDRMLIDELKSNARMNGFKDIVYITNENDSRTGLGGFSA